MVIIDEKAMLRLNDIARRLFDEQLRPNMFKVHMEALRVFLAQSGEPATFDLIENQKKYEL